MMILINLFYGLISRCSLYKTGNYGYFNFIHWLLYRSIHIKLTCFVLHEYFFILYFSCITSQNLFLRYNQKWQSSLERSPHYLGPWIIPPYLKSVQHIHILLITSQECFDLCYQHRKYLKQVSICCQMHVTNQGVVYREAFVI